jgi:hypothetical protein
MLLSCLLASAAVLPNTRHYFAIECMLARIEAQLANAVYDPALFNGALCGPACYAYDLNAIGMSVSDPDNRLFSRAGANASMLAIASSRHCRTADWGGFVWTDCALQKMLTDAHWHRPAHVPREYAELMAGIHASEAAVAVLTQELVLLRGVAEHDLDALCNQSTFKCPAHLLLLPHLSPSAAAAAAANTVTGIGRSEL